MRRPALAVMITLFAICLVSGSQALGALVNIARGCPVTLSPTPNYPLCTDPGDAAQLTDGKYASGKLWSDLAAVGWKHIPGDTSVPTFTIDLGGIYSIDGLSLSTASQEPAMPGLQAGFVAVSDDGATWRYVCDLVDRYAPDGVPSSGTYAAYKISTQGLGAVGRYVRVVMYADSGVSCLDEFEVYSGGRTANTPGSYLWSSSDWGRFLPTVLTHRAIIRTLRRDLDYARQPIYSAKVTANVRAQLLSQLSTAAKGLAQVSVPDISTFDAVVPYNATHAAILAVFGQAVRANGLPEIYAWKQHRYEPVYHMDAPSTAPKSVSLSVDMMRNEHRADAFLLTNASGKPIIPYIRVSGLPGAPGCPWLRVAVAPSTGTSTDAIVASALPWLQQSVGAWMTTIPAGMTRKVWLDVDSSKLSPGRYSGELQIRAPGYDIRLPFRLYVSRVTMPRPRLSLTVWDYSYDMVAAKRFTMANADAMVANMRAHYVDSPWCHLSVPPDDAFDMLGRIIRPIDLSPLGTSVDAWPDARLYLAAVGVGERIGGFPLTEPGFTARAGSWAQAMSAYMRSLGHEPRTLGLLLDDEPSTQADSTKIRLWTQAIDASAPELTMFQTISSPRPDLAPVRDAITPADIVCMHGGALDAGGTAVVGYSRQLQAQGKAIWLYSTSGPAKALDPQNYYRREAWRAFRYGARGIGFWAFTDMGDSVDSWNECSASYLQPPYAPAFITSTTVTDSIHWEAVREGVEDYEYLAMLQDAASKTKNTDLKTRANKLIAEAVSIVTSKYVSSPQWNPDAARNTVDDYRLKILTLLEALP